MPADLSQPSLSADEAHAEYDGLAAVAPDDPAELLRLGQMGLQLGRDAEALEWSTRAAEADPSSASALVAKGRALNRLGRVDEAIRAMAAAVAIDPDVDAALNRLRYLLTEQTSTRAALGRIAGRGLEIASVLDVGASDGSWSLAARALWPDARFHLIEAFDHWRPALESLCAREPSFSHVVAAAGASEGEIYFRNNPAAPYGGAASERPIDGGWRVPQVSLAGEARRLGLPAPYLIKLDTHGFELPILEGARPLFADAALVVIETYLFRLRENGPLFHEIVSFMEDHGFRPTDLSDPLWRATDQALWQIDLYFVRAGESRRSSWTGA